MPDTFLSFCGKYEAAAAVPVVFITIFYALQNDDVYLPLFIILGNNNQILKWYLIAISSESFFSVQSPMKHLYNIVPDSWWGHDQNLENWREKQKKIFHKFSYCNVQSL